MAQITQNEILRRIKATYQRVDKAVVHPDRKRRPYLNWMESIMKPSSFEGGGQTYLMAKQFNMQGNVWVGDDELEAESPEFQLNLSYGYFNLNTAVTVKHDFLTQLGYTMMPNGDGNLESRVIGESEDQKYRFMEWLYHYVEGQRDDHDRLLELILLGTGALGPNYPVGLFGMLTFNNSTGLIGGVDRATETVVRHVVDTSLTITSGGNFRKQWDEAVIAANLYSHTNGVQGEIDVYFGGRGAMAGYKTWAELNNWRVNRDTMPLKKLDSSIPDTALQFNEVPVVHLPAMEILDTLYPGNNFTNTIVGLNSKTWAYKNQRGKYKHLSAPQDPPKQRVSRQDIDTTAHLACRAPASNLILRLA